MKARYLLSMASVAMLATACASGSGARASDSQDAASVQPERTAESGATQTTTAPRRVRRAPNLLSTEELREAPQGNLYDVISSLRPEWLRTSGTSSVLGSNAIIVYVDGARMGTPSALRQVPTSQARRVTFFSPTEAQARFGVGHASGAIQVETGR